MKPFEIYIAYVAWETGGKRRPLLVFSNSGDRTLTFRITTQYERKSPAIRSEYFKIKDWREAGLDRQSYVDTITLLEPEPDAIPRSAFIGKLTERDKKNLIDFLSK